MDYLMSVYMDENMTPPSAEVIQTMYKQVDVFNQELQDAGAWIYAGGLEPSSTATTIDYLDGNTVVTDGPYAETKEQLGGFWVIKADDLDAALAWGTKASAACMGKVEVRPFQPEPQS